MIKKTKTKGYTTNMNPFLNTLCWLHHSTFSVFLSLLHTSFHGAKFSIDHFIATPHSVFFLSSSPSSKALIFLSSLHPHRREILS